MPVLGTAEAVRRVRALGLQVLTFGGYGELGYDDEAAALALCRAELARHDPRRTAVATGTLITQGFRRGIAMVYPLARSMGFTTLGVHPSVALADRSRYRLAEGVDHAFFVADTTWGGTDAQGRPSATLQVLLGVSQAFVAIGGGEHTAQELRAFLQAGTPVRFEPARMHAGTVERWTRASGAHVADLDGAAQRFWLHERATPAAARPDALAR